MKPISHRVVKLMAAPSPSLLSFFGFGKGSETEKRSRLPAFIMMRLPKEFRAVSLGVLRLKVRRRF